MNHTTSQNLGTSGTSPFIGGTMVEVAEVKPLTLNLPEPEHFLGQILEPGKSRGFAKWLEALPEGSLELASHEQLEGIERIASERFSGGIGEFIHVGRNRLELVSPLEAELFRSERRPPSEATTENYTQVAAHPSLDNCVLIGGLSHRSLTSQIGRKLGLSPAQVSFGNFASSETRVAIGESVRDKKVFVIQTMGEPVNEHVMETNLLVDALKRASAKEINVITPLYGYARGDRKGDERAPVSAALFAKLLAASGAHRIVTVDVHSAQTEGFFDGPLDNLFAAPILISHLVEKYGEDNLIVVGADEGQFKRLIPIVPEIEAALGEDRGKDLAIAAMSKIRTRPGEVDRMRFIGNPADVAGRTAILWDDMGDTLGTIDKAAEMLRELGASKVVVVLTHLIGSWGGIERLRNSFLPTHDGNRIRLVNEVVCTDTLPLRRGKGDLITQLSVDELLAEAILRIARSEGDSLRELRGYFGYKNRQVVH